MGNVRFHINSRIPFGNLEIPWPIQVPVRFCLPTCYRERLAHWALVRRPWGGQRGAMCLHWFAAAVLVVAQAGLYAQAGLPESPEKLVREVAYNELQDHHAHSFWRFWIERNLQNETQREDQVETAEGPITRLSLSNGRPLSPKFERQEQARLLRLLGSPSEQARSREVYAEGEERIGRVVALMPDAFLYEDDGVENGCRRLRFRSNPTFQAHSIEARIFHAMSGTLCVDTRYKRLVRFNGQLEENVDFGFGILGRLCKGSWFQLKRTQVSATDWKTAGLEVHITGRAVLVKAISHEMSEVRGGFVQVPAGLNLIQGMKLLQQSASKSEARPPLHGIAASSLIAAPALALRR
jgi:hypothetical protein